MDEKFEKWFNEVHMAGRSEAQKSFTRVLTKRIYEAGYLAALEKKADD